MLREIRNLTDFWNSERWNRIKRPYSKEDVIKFCHSFMIDYTLANSKSEIFWSMLCQEDQIYGMSACNAEESLEQVEAGMDFLCLNETSNSNINERKNISRIVNNINKVFRVGYGSTPVIVKTKAMSFKNTTKIIQSGVAGIWCEDELLYTKHHKTGVLVSTKKMISQLAQIRLAADVCRVPSIIIASTKGCTSNLIECDGEDLQDQKFVTSKKFTIEGYQHLDGDLSTEIAINRGLAYAPYADVICLEGNIPDIKQAETFAKAIRSKFPRKFLAYSCTPDFDWTTRRTPTELMNFQNELTELGYSIQYICPRHDSYYPMRKLAESYCDDGFAGYANLQEIYPKIDYRFDSNEILNTIQEERGTLI